MPVVRISDRTWERLKGYARPLEDTADDVINRALDALDSRPRPEDKAVDVISRALDPLDSRPRPISGPKVVEEPDPAKPGALGEKISQPELRASLLETLAQLGGRSGLKEIREAMEPKLRARLSKADYERVSTGEERWWNKVCWIRNDLVKEGILTKTSPRGIWELSSKNGTL